jgi:DNA adenine methylase
MLEATEKAARPFMKWAGGKGKLLPQLQQYFPTDYNNYFEPFFGGGAVFFSLSHTGRSHINDINDTLMDAYIHLRDDIEKIIVGLQRIDHEYKSLDVNERKEFYLKQRLKFNSLEACIEKTILLIFLNKTCFNGLYRENSKGEFNVPFGQYANPTICDIGNLYAVSHRLKNAVITAGPYNDSLISAKKGDFVYFDPPYMPLNATSSFTSYHADGFTIHEQERLKEVFDELDKRGCYVMLSNSSADVMKELYKAYRQEFVEAGRSINASGTKRGKIPELVVLNY